MVTLSYSTITGTFLTPFEYIIMSFNFELSAFTS